MDQKWTFKLLKNNKKGENKIEFYVWVSCNVRVLTHLPPAKVISKWQTRVLSDVYGHGCCAKWILKTNQESAFSADGI